MRYRIVHKTTYTYQQPVSFGTHVAYLVPRTQPHHLCEAYEVLVPPYPSALRERADFFGNTSVFFTIDEPHSELTLEARSRVMVDGPASCWPQPAPAWDEAARSLSSDLSAEELDAYQFVFESPR